jgi:hypothetical protein
MNRHQVFANSIRSCRIHLFAVQPQEYVPQACRNHKTYLKDTANPRAYACLGKTFGRVGSR